MQEPMITDAKSSGIELERRELKRLMRRTDGHGLAHFFGWLATLLVLGYGLHLSLGTWWVVPAMIVFGVALGVGAYSMSHECAHGTAFKTRWLNETVF